MIRRLLGRAAAVLGYEEEGREYCGTCGWWARPHCGHAG